MSSKAILQAIKKNKTFLVTTHVHPDIDGLSSQIMMALYLKSLGKKVYAVNVGKVSLMHKFLPSIGLVKSFKNQHIHFDAAIVLDCGDLERIDIVRKLIAKDTTVINIDHHITNDHFGHLNLIDPKASSTAEVLFNFLKNAKGKLTKSMAELCYLGIMTDTGSFRYDNTMSQTHAIVSELLKFNFSVHKFYKTIYETVPLKDLKLFTTIISRFEITHKGKVVSIQLSEDLLNKFSQEFDLRDKIFSFLRMIKGIEVIVIFTQVKNNLTRLNFRSQGKTDVAKLASFFEGGGHKKASGGRINANLKEAKKRVLSKLKEALP